MTDVSAADSTSAPTTSAPTDSDSNVRANEAALDLLFRSARTYNGWLPRDISDAQLHEIYELYKWGPTSANSGPARILFVRTVEAKERLLPAMSGNNVDKTRAAPVTAVIAYDMEFYEHLPKLFPARDLSGIFRGNQALIEETGLRNSSLQGAYFMLAARAVGLDCGPMSGFDAAKVNAEFFADGKWKVNFICNLGYGDPKSLYPRAPRLDFDEVCRIL